MRTTFRKQAVVICMMLMIIGTLVVPAMGGILVRDRHSLNDSEPIGIQCVTNEDAIEITYHLTHFTQVPVDIDGGQYVRVELGDESHLLEKGMPDIPDIRRSILIPDSAKMSIVITYSNYKIYKNLYLAPSKGNIPRTLNPDTVPYEFDDVYTENEWYPREIATLSDPYILCDYRGQVVQVCPFQYNPVAKELRFYTDITVTITPTGEDTINCLIRTELPSAVASDFMRIYERHFLNFNAPGRYTPVEEQGNMLIITYDDFWDEMMPFYEWKIMKGIPTEMINVSEIGNANDIATHIDTYYHTEGLTFVLLVGDDTQLPTLYLNSYACDPGYSYVEGSDHYPDLFVGRFSAENPNDLITQIERSVEYEKTPQDGAEWYHKGTGVASNLGPGDDGEYDDEHMDNIRTDLLVYTYTEVDQIYDPYGTATMVATAVNDGRSIINYCGHGSRTSWSSTGFSNSHVNQLVNDNMLPFIISVACYNGAFDGATCFAEAWMRATNNDEPTGSIANFMSAKSQGWNPPMDAQDEIVDILVESYPDNIKHSFGALCFNGCMHMNDEYGYSGYVETDAWTVFGDPSLQVRTDTPGLITVTHDPQVGGTATSFEVTVTGVENALCAISRDTELFGYAYTDATGHAVIQFKDPIPGLEPVTLVVTAYNKETYIATLQLNGPPAVPDRPEGPGSGKPGVEYLFTTSTIDPDGDDVFYMWRWGDGNYSDWLGPHDSGVTASATHIWDETGNYQIRVKAKDINGAETDWSDPLPIAMPVNKPLLGTFFFKLLGEITR
jgi:hypothetical protein